MSDIKPVFNVDYRNTDELLKLVQKRSGYAMKALVRDLAYYAGQSAVLLTPPGKSNLRNLPKKYKIRKQRNRRGKKLVKAWDKNKNMFIWIESPPAAEKIPHAGAAKAGFVKALRDIGNQEPQGEQGIPRGIGYGMFINRTNGYMAKLSNRVSYGQKIAAAVPAQALRLAEARMLGRFWAKRKEYVTKKW